MFKLNRSGNSVKVINAHRPEGLDKIFFHAEGYLTCLRNKHLDLKQILNNLFSLRNEFINQLASKLLTESASDA